MTNPVEEHLAHHGVKGMKWGQRKDKKWQKNIYSVRGAVAVHNAVADRMNNGGLASVNNKPKYKGKKLIDDFGDPIGKTGKEYVNEINKMGEKFTHEAVKQVHGVSPSGSYKAKLDTSNPNQWSIKVVKNEAAHAVLAEEDFEYEVQRDKNGAITSAKLVKDGLQHAEEVLEHHGVKGMRWGVRRKVGPNGRVVGKPGKQPSVDFKTTKDLRKRKPSTLSNMQLKKVNERMNLEKKFSEMNPTKIKKGKEAAGSLLKVATGAAGAAGIRELVTNPKYANAVKTGAKTMKFRASGTGRLLSAVGKGKYG